MKKLILLKVITVKYAQFATTGAATTTTATIATTTNLNRGFKFQKSVCNNCHDLLMFSLNISNTNIITVLIFVALFMTLANLSNSFCYKILWVMIVGIYKMHIKN